MVPIPKYGKLYLPQVVSTNVSLGHPVFQACNNAPTLPRPPTPGRACTGGDLQKLFDKFPTPGNDFVLQIPYSLYRDFKINEHSRTNAPINPGNKLHLTNHYKSPPAINYLTWARWGLTMIGAYNGM